MIEKKDDVNSSNSDDSSSDEQRLDNQNYLITNDAHALFHKRRILHDCITCDLFDWFNWLNAMIALRVPSLV